MERQHTRIDTVRQHVDSIINSIEDMEDQRCAYVHLMRRIQRVLKEIT